MEDDRSVDPGCRTSLMRITVASDRDDSEEVEALLKSFASAARAKYRMSENHRDARDHYVSGTRSQLREFVKRLDRSGLKGLLLGGSWEPSRAE